MHCLKLKNIKLETYYHFQFHKKIKMVKFYLGGIPKSPEFQNLRDNFISEYHPEIFIFRTNNQMDEYELQGNEALRSSRNEFCNYVAAFLDNHNLDHHPMINLCRQILVVVGDNEYDKNEKWTLHVNTFDGFNENLRKKALNAAKQINDQFDIQLFTVSAVS